MRIDDEGHKKREVNTTVDGLKLKMVEHFKYLGMAVNGRWEMGIEVERKIFSFLNT